jgi:hypothetical protein
MSAEQAPPKALGLAARINASTSNFYRVLGHKISDRPRKLLLLSDARTGASRRPGPVALSLARVFTAV